MQIENWVDGVVGGHHGVAAAARVASLVDHRAVMMIGDHRQVGVDGIARLAVVSPARVAVHPPRQVAAVTGGANHPLGDGANHGRHHLERVARAEAAQASLESLADHRPVHGLTICGALLHHGDIHRRLASLVRVEARQALLLPIVGDILDGVNLGANRHLQVENLARVKDPRVKDPRVARQVMENGYGYRDGAIGDHLLLVESLARAAALLGVDLSMNGMVMDGMVVLPNLKLNRSIQREALLADGKPMDGTMMDITRLTWTMYELRL